MFDKFVFLLHMSLEKSNRDGAAQKDQNDGQNIAHHPLGVLHDMAGLREAELGVIDVVQAKVLGLVELEQHGRGQVEEEVGKVDGETDEEHERAQLVGVVAEDGLEAWDEESDALHEHGNVEHGGVEVAQVHDGTVDVGDVVVGDGRVAHREELHGRGQSRVDRDERDHRVGDRVEAQIDEHGELELFRAEDHHAHDREQRADEARRYVEGRHQHVH